MILLDKLDRTEIAVLKWLVLTALLDTLSTIAFTWWGYGKWETNVFFVTLGNAGFWVAGIGNVLIIGAFIWLIKHHRNNSEFRFAWIGAASFFIVFRTAAVISNLSVLFTRPQLVTVEAIAALPKPAVASMVKQYLSYLTTGLFVGAILEFNYRFIRKTHSLKYMGGDKK